MARIANAVHCHNLLSDYKDCHEFRFSIVRIVISVTNPRIVFVAVVVSQKSENLRKLWKSSKSLTDQMSHRSQVGSL